MPKHPGRGGAAWRAARARALAGATHCYLCGGALDFNAPPRSPNSPSVDHVVPLKSIRGLPMSEQRRIALDPRLLRPCHLKCNSSRGAGRKPKNPPPPRRQSRKW